MAWAIPVATSALGAFAAKKIAGKPPAPPTPLDAAASTAAQSAANTQAAQTAAAINRPDQTNPYGTLNWTQSETDPNAWSSQMTLTPESQGLLTSSQQNAANTLNTPINQPGPIDLQFQNQAARANYNDFTAQNTAAAALAGEGRGAVSQALSQMRETAATPFNYESLGAAPQANEAARKAIEESLYQRSTARLDPRFAQSEDAMNTALANQGITQGSEAYNRERQNFAMGKNDAYSSAMNDAISGSDTALAKLFGMELSGRQQGADEINAMRTIPAQERALMAQTGLSADAAAREWQQMMDQQEGMQDQSAMNRIGVISAQNQDQFANAITARQQAMNELGQTKAAIDPGFTQNNVTGVSSPDVLGAQTLQQAGQTANYNVGAAANNAQQSAYAQMIAQLLAARQASKTPEINT